MLGKVIRINVIKGFGFIEGEDKKDYFFHLQDVQRSGKAFRHYASGDAVSFEPGPATNTNQCPKAFKVMQLSDMPISEA